MLRMVPLPVPGWNFVIDLPVLSLALCALAAFIAAFVRGMAPAVAAAPVVDVALMVLLPA